MEASPRGSSVVSVLVVGSAPKDDVGHALLRAASPFFGTLGSPSQAEACATSAAKVTGYSIRASPVAQLKAGCGQDCPPHDDCQELRETGRQE